MAPVSESGDVDIEAHYDTVGWPWKRLDTPSFRIEVEWDVEQVLGYLRTWSASQRYLREHGEDPIELVEKELRRAWGSALRTVRWPLTVRVTRL